MTTNIEEEFPSLNEQLKEAQEFRDQLQDDLVEVRETLKKIQNARAETQRQFDEMERRTQDQILQLEDNLATMNRILNDLLHHLKSEGRA